MTVTDDRPSAVLGTRAAAHVKTRPCSRARRKYTNDLNLPGRAAPGGAAQPVRPRPHPERRHVGRALAVARRGRRVQRRRPGRHVGRADAVRVAVTRRHEEPGPLPARRRTRPATSATAWRACWPPATPPPATRSTLIDVQYEPLPAVVDLEDALSDRVVIHDDLGTNTQLHVGPEDRGRTRARSTRPSPTRPTR